MCRQSGYIVRWPFASIIVPDFLGDNSLFCYQVEQQAYLGNFDGEETCELLPDLVEEYCGGCIIAPDAPTASYTPTSTYAPSHGPFTPDPSPYPVTSPYPVNFDDGFDTEEESNSTLGSYLMYLIFAVVSCFGFASMFYLKSKRQQQEGTMEMIATSHAPLAGSVNNSLDAAQAAAIEEKLRPLVLDALFPEQKVSTRSQDFVCGSKEYF